MKSKKKIRPKQRKSFTSRTFSKTDVDALIKSGTRFTFGYKDEHGKNRKNVIQALEASIILKQFYNYRAGKKPLWYTFLILKKFAKETEIVSRLPLSRVTATKLHVRLHVTDGNN